MWQRRRIRGRDIRAICFCLFSIPAVFLVAWIAARRIGLNIWLPSVAATGAYAVWLLTRPRMVRVFRRLRGERIMEWTGYYDN